MAASLELAISAIRSGRQEEGRQLLNLLIQQNPNDEKAWMWMSSVVETDEQRARCLYHVLAINPNSEIARRGLQVLGIVVSDSRPVKVPRDSQPIKIPKPTAQTAGQPTPYGERRPFLIDPQTVTRELPFTPANTSFSESVQASPSILAMDVSKEVGGDNTGMAVDVLQDEAPSKPVPVTNAPARGQEGASSPAKSGLLARLSTSGPVAASTDTQDMVAPSGGQTEQNQDPSRPVPSVTATDTQEMVSQSDSQPVPVVQSRDPRLTDTQELIAPQPGQVAQRQYPSEPVPVIRSVQARHPSEPVPVANVGMTPPGQTPPDTGPLPAGPAGPMIPLPGQLPAPGSGPLPQQPVGEPMSAPIPTDTRPSQPTPVVAYPDPNMGVVQGSSNVYYQQMPAPHSSPTVGMSGFQPTQSPYPSQPVSSIHSNTTMGMPISVPNMQPQHPSEPVPVVHSSGTLGMAPYGYPQPPQNLALHSGATMMMPTMSEAEARARLATGPAIPTANATAMALQNASYQGGATYMAYNEYDVAEDDEDEDEVNILAVIIFGTLSVTALGGLGMLILLVFTTPAA